MLGDRRVVVLSHIERLFKGRKKLAEGIRRGGWRRCPRAQSWWPRSVCVQPRALQRARARCHRHQPEHETGETARQAGRDGRVRRRSAPEGFDGAQSALRSAMQFAANRVKAAGKRIDAAGVTALVERAGPDIGRLRKDIDTLVIFVGDATAITEQDVTPSWSARRSSSMTGRSPMPLLRATPRDRAAARATDGPENGSSPFPMLGQLGWWVRTKMTQPPPDRERGRPWACSTLTRRASRP